MTQSDAPCLDLPADLLAAEQAMLQAALAAVGSGDGQRWATSLRFEGLRLLPVSVRLARALIAAGQQLVMVWPDAGAAALARRDGAYKIILLECDFFLFARKLKPQKQ